MSHRKASTRCRRWRCALGLLVVVLLVAACQFVFNPLGLGPEPEATLGPAFFEKSVGAMDGFFLLVDGREAFEAVFEAIDAAKESIYIQTFIWKDDETGKAVVNRLREAADRGVQVTVNKDLLGTAFELGDMIKGRPSPVFTRAGLRGYPNIEVNTKVFTDNDHSKYFIVDHETLIFGGMNIADEYHFQWHDYMGLIRGRERVALFESRVLYGTPWPGSLPAVIAVNDRQGTEIRQGLVEAIDHARERVVLEHAYFSDEVIIETLLRAASRGVRVDLVLPAEPDTHGAANKVTINRLLDSEHRENIHIFFYPAMSHAKVLMTDGVIAAVGSANLTPRSMLTSREVTLFVHGDTDTAFTRRLNEQLEEDIGESTEVRERFQLSMADRFNAVVGKYVW